MSTEAEEIRKLLDRLNDICQGKWETLTEAAQSPKYHALVEAMRKSVQKE
jgi:hypothetical protein